MIFSSFQIIGERPAYASVPPALPSTTNNDPTVHIYVNGNGYIVLNSSFSGFNYQNDKIANFTDNSVPYGTVFNLTVDPNSGYYFIRWQGTVNSTARSLNLVVNTNINEEAVYASSTLYSVTFNETGLPTNTPWYLNITSGNSYNSTGNSLNFYALDGNYSYSISTTNKSFSPNITSKNFEVSGSSLNISVNFTELFHKVTFDETGLPAGVNWTLYVDLHKQIFENTLLKSVGPLSNNTYVLFLPNTSSSSFLYRYQAITNNVSYESLEGYFSGSFGSLGSLTIPVKFIPTPNVTFTENQLPAGAIWWVNISGGPSSRPINGSSYTTLLKIENSTYIYNYTVSTSDKDFKGYTYSFDMYPTQTNVTVIFNTVTWMVAFDENIFPAIDWKVVISDGQNMSGYDNGFDFQVQNGTYTYSITSLNPNYTVVKDYGNFTVDGAPTILLINFSKKLYDVSFTETGLPTGTQWSINTTGGQTFKTSTRILSIQLANGSYLYFIYTADKRFAPSSYSGDFLISGINLTFSVSFTEVKYSVSFNETGLPVGDSWYLNITGMPSSGQVYDTSYSAKLPNGSYSYEVSTSNKLYLANTSEFVVGGSRVTINVKFVPVTYKVVFYARSENPHALNPPAGIPWYVNITNGQNLQSTSNNISFYEPNGSYSYNVSIGDHIYRPIPGSGSFTINGSQYSKDILFEFVTYTVEFKEHGIPNYLASMSKQWYVNVTGRPSDVSIQPTLSISLSNGTYYYTLSSGNYSFEPSTRTGTFTVMGNNVTVPASFNPTYSVKLIENGIPNGNRWFVSGPNGSSFNSTGYVIVLHEVNGTYSFTAKNETAFYTMDNILSVLVKGANLTENINYYHYAYINGSVFPVNATVTVDGKTMDIGNNGMFNFSEISGSYHIVVSAKGYRNYYANFTLNQSAVKNLAINLRPLPSKSASISKEIYVGAGFAVAIGIMAVIVSLVRRHR
ncbi:MAG: hypothetical protein B2I17_02040 [Thermoplasmatales archaeon B_DKE]|nr:MAG: hypothetical protein B2I17_02040 [Thermoplasmatales archaeon B_DKE]